MKVPHALLHQLEAYAQEELDLQTRLIATLDAQREALFSGDLELMRANAGVVDEQLRGSAQRAQRRHELLTRLGAHFGVEPKTLTLSSICERLGADGRRLEKIAASLRGVTQDVARCSRRLSALARMHVRMNEEILDEVLAGRGTNSKSFDRSGALLNAEV